MTDKGLFFLPDADGAQAFADIGQTAVRGLFDFVWPGHKYTLSETLPGSRNISRDRINAEACVLPGGSSTAPIRSGQQYDVGASPGNVRVRFPNPDNAVLGITEPQGAPGFELPVGRVTTVQDSRDPYHFTNTTEAWHPFRGTVDRRFSRAPDGSIVSTTEGQGRSRIPFLDYYNQWKGPQIFRDQNAACAAAVFGQRPR